MPRFSSAAEPDYSVVSTRQQAVASEDDKSFAKQYQTGLDKSFFTSASALALGSTVDLVDTVSSSVLPGVERGDVNRQFNSKILNQIGGAGMSNWMDQNRGALEVGSGIAGTVIANWGAGKLLGALGKTTGVLRDLPFVKTVANLDSQYEKALRVSRLASMESANRGAMGVTRFLGEEMNLAALGGKPLTVSVGQASKNVYKAGIAKGLVQNVTTEALMATTLHSNSMLYSDDLAHNLAWSAAGLGIGAGIDNLVSTYALRKIANSDRIRQLNARAFDPAGLEAQRIHGFSTADRIMREAGITATDDISWLRHGGADEITDEVTSYAIQGSQLARQPESQTQRAKQLFGRREEISTPVQAMAMETMNKATVKGLRGVKGSGFGGDVEGLTKPINQSLHMQPESMYGISEIGTLPEGMTREMSVAERAQKLDAAFQRNQQLLKDGGVWQRRKVKTKDGDVFQDTLIPLKDEDRAAIRAEQLDLQNAKSHTMLTMLEPGEWAPIEWGKIADNFEPRVPMLEGGLGDGDLAVWSMPKKSPAEPTIGVSNNGELFLPEAARGRPENLTPEESLHFYNTANKAVRDIASSDQTFMVPKNASWAVLDMAEQIIKQAGDPAKVKFYGSMSREDALVEAFAQKVDILKRKQAAQRLNQKRGINQTFDDAKGYALKVQLNLPRLTPYEHGLMASGEHPIDVLLHGFESGAQVRQMSYQELIKGVNDARAIAGFTDDTRYGLDSLVGTSYNFLRDAEGNPMKPIVAARRALRPMEWTRDQLFVRRAMRETQVRETLLGDNADEFTRLLTDGLASNPVANEARNVIQLADDQSRSFVPGFRHAAPQTTEGAFINSITTRDRRDVDNLTMRSASQIQEQKTRLIQGLTKAVFEKHMGNLITEVNSARNTRSKMLLDQFGSFRQGWEIGIKPREFTLPSGERGYAFVLDHESVLNQKRFKEAFGRDLAKGQDLLNPDGNAIVLDDLGMKVLTAMQGVHADTLSAKNTLLRSQNLSEIKSTPFYWPPAVTKDKYVEYTFGLDGQVVPGMTLIADTPAEMAKLKEELLASDQWKDGYKLRNQNAVESFMTLWDKHQMEFVAPNTTAIQPKKSNFGRTSGNQINTKSFEEALGVMRDSLLKHGDDVIDILYDAPIRSARARAAVAKEATTVGSRKAVEHSSIYDRYLQNLTGRSSLSAQDSFWGEPYKWAEQRINGFLASSPVERASQIVDTMGDYLRVVTPWGKDKLPTATYNRFAQELGEYMPFKSVTQMLERQTGSKTPTEIADITSKMSWFEASSRLRWFESMHAVVNFASQVANMPAVIRALQPMRGESVAEAAARNGNLSMMLHLSDKESVIVPNQMGLIWQSMRDAQKSLPDEFTQKAIQRGLMGQEVAEYNRAFNAIDSKAGWRGFMFGDAGRKADELKGPFKAARAKVATSGGLDKWLGVLSDKSEDFTRAWGMYAGRRTAQAMGIHDVDAQLNFSHELVNQMIANYDPRNRAEIFQGALGAPLGLFQSYTVNFYQRMFRYLETGNTRALATQYATQAGVFGTSSLPGWDQLNWAFFDQGGAENADPIESLSARLGKDMADLVQHGTLSNLPKIFGGDGMAIYTRGDTQFRMPVNPLNLVKGDALISVPFTDTIGRILGGIGQAATTFKAMNGDVGPSQIAEIVSNMLTNRPLAGMVEMFGAGGVDTDQMGQAVAESSLKEMNGWYRVLGTRSMVQQKSIESFYANRNAQEEQGSRKSVLNTATRQAIREGKFDSIPGLFAKYVQEGGDPRSYSSWIKRSFDAANNTRDERMLKKALNDPNNQSNALIARLLDGEVDVAEDENNSDDYGQQDMMEKLIADGWQTEPTATMPDDPTESQEPSGW